MTTEGAAFEAADRQSIFAKATGFAVIAILSVTFAIALSSIIYVGPLTAYAGQGIGLALLGGTVMPIVGSLLCSDRATVFHIQDIPALLISLAAVSVAASLSPGIAFATVATMIALTCVLTGVVLYLGSVLNLGFVARYIPYSVIGGFLAATGFLLTTGGLGMMVDAPVTLFSPGALFAAEALSLWTPWFAFGVLTVWATRTYDSPLVLPGAILAGGVAFYLVLWALDLPLAAAGERGMLLGPFPTGGFTEGLSYGIAITADWGQIVAQSSTIIAVIAMTFIGVLLNASGLEVATGQDLDMQRELRATGLANIASGGVGGHTGFHLLGETVLGRQMGLTGLAPAMAVVFSNALVLFFGAGLIGMLPVGLLAGLIVMLGVDFLYTWIWVKLKPLPGTDRAVVLLIVAVAATIGFLEAFFVGLLAASVLFITSYAGIDVVRLTTTAATRRSSVERRAEDAVLVQAEAQRTAIYELTGYLFFGTAHRLLDRIRQDLEKRPEGVGLIVDFSRVTGLDSSAAFMLDRIATLAARHGQTFTVTGLTDDLGRRFLAEAEATRNITIHPTLDDALISIEESVLPSDDAPDIDVYASLAEIGARHPDLDIARFVTPVAIAAGKPLFRRGETSSTVYRLISGSVKAMVPGLTGEPMVIARFRPGALVGEIAYYATHPRTADVLAESDCTLLAYDLAAMDDDPGAAAFAREFHREAAELLSLRLARMTKLVRDAGL